ILKLGLNYPRLDEIYYFMGFYQSEMGSTAEALKSFKIIADRYSSSPFASEAYRELADEAFRKNDFRKAVGYYEAAAKRAVAQKSESTPRILHRLAWAYYRTRQFPKAVQALKDAIARTTQDQERFISLKEEAMRDMAVFMTELGQVDEAITYFQSIASEQNFYPKTLERLGRQYERNVELAKAMQVYESLLKTHPEDEAAFRVRVKLVDLDLRKSRFKEALNRLKSAKLYTTGESDTQTSWQNLRAMIRRTATENHESFRKKGTRASLGIAEDFYTAYLTQILPLEDARNETPEIRMYLADVKRELGKAREASELYRVVLEGGDKRYAKEAGALWTASLSEAIKKAPQSKSKTEPGELEKEFIDAADRMQEALSELPEGREAALRAAQVLAGYSGTRKEAMGRLEKIVDKAPGSQQAVTAARLWLQILSDLAPANTQLSESSEGSDLKETAEKLTKNSALMATDKAQGGKLAAQVAEIETKWKVSKIAVLESDKSYEKAGAEYEAFAASSNKLEIIDKAFEGAMNSYSLAENSEAVDRVTDAWAKRVPKSQKRTDALKSIATQSLIRGQFSFSAVLFEKIGKQEKDPDSLETAARIFEGAGEAARSRKIQETYLELFPKAPRRYWIALSLAQDLERSKNESQAASYYKYCMTGGGSLEAECGARLGDLYLKTNDIVRSKEVFKRMGQMKVAAGVSSPFIAYARFRLTEFLEKETQFEPLKLPESVLRKSLAQRLQFLEPLSRGYHSAMEAGGPWAIAALDRLAGWAYKFSQELEAVQPPSQFTDIALKNFRASLRQVSEPLRRKALDTWNDSYQKANDLELLSPVIPSIADRLAQLKRPGVYRAQGFRGRFRIAGISSDGGSLGQKEALVQVRERLLKNGKDALAWLDYGNLLWGTAKPVLARIAYERALSIQPKNLGALTNRAVVLLSLPTVNFMGENPGDSEGDWLRALEANEAWKEVLKIDEFDLAAKMNRAYLLNYYRLFKKSKVLLDQVVGRVNQPDVLASYAIALQGIGQAGLAEQNFKKGSDLGRIDASGFSEYYHQAARLSDLKSDYSGALDALSEISKKELGGFELFSFTRLKQSCEKKGESP
ncbi:MAG: hypothetical protein JNL01_12265, partial [Bdellovibrionales bacterium]|nr:hypothetical protein [Bdellovibrionales bacterium]